MSGVWGWFGGQSAQKRKDTPKNAILGLRSQLEMLQKRERHLQNQMDEQDAIARKNVSTNKNGTLRFPNSNYTLSGFVRQGGSGISEITFADEFIKVLL